MDCSRQAKSLCDIGVPKYTRLVGSVCTSTQYMIRVMAASMILARTRFVCLTQATVAFVLILFGTVYSLTGHHQCWDIRSLTQSLHRARHD